MREPIVEVETSIAAPPRAVWQAMQQGAMFPGTRIETDWKIGRPIVFRGEWKGRSFIDRGEIQSLAEAEELSFTHWSDNEDTGQRPPSWHLVRYRLAPAGEGTNVTVSQFNEGQDTEVDAAARAEFAKNWTMMLDGLKQAAEAA